MAVPADSATAAALDVLNLTFAYPSHEPLVRNLSMTLPRGSRCLLCGANGGGKSTLLQVFGASLPPAFS